MGVGRLSEHLGELPEGGGELGLVSEAGASGTCSTMGLRLGGQVLL